MNKLLRTSLFLLFLTGNFFGLSGQSLQQAEKLLAAESYFEAAVQLKQFIKQHPTRQYDLADANYLWSYAALQLGDYLEAHKRNDKSLKLRRRLGSDAIADNYLRRGAIYLHQGKYTDAIAALEDARQRPNGDPLLFPLIDGYLGQVWEQLGDPVRARGYFQRSINSIRVDFGDVHPDLASLRHQMALSFFREGKHEAAEAALERAKSSAIRKDQAAEQALLKGLILLEKNEAEQLNTANEAFKAAFDLYAAIPKRSGMVRSLCWQSLTQYHQQRWSTAEQLLQMAHDQLYPHGASQANTVAAYPDVALFWEVVAAQGAMLEYEHSNQSDRLETALERVLAGTNRFEQLKGFAHSPSDELAHRRSFRQLLNIGMAASHELYLRTDQHRFIDTAFVLMEHGKAQLLQQRFFIDQQLEQLPKKQQADISKLRAESAHYQLLAAKAQYEQTAMVKANEKRFELVQLLQKAGVRSSVFQPVSLHDARQQLSSSAALINYHLTEEDYYIIAASQDELMFKRLPADYTPQAWHKTTVKKSTFKLSDHTGIGAGTMSKLDIRLKLPKLDAAVRGTLRAAKKSDLKKFAFYASNLYGKVLHPVQSVISGKDHLIILPDGVLYQLPFELLIKKDPGPDNIRFNKLPYLIKDHSVRYHYSAAAFFNARTTASNSGFLGIAPVFDQSGSGNELAVEHVALRDSSRLAGDFEALDDNRQSFKPLVASSGEVEGIHATFLRKKQPTTTLLRELATEQSFKELAPQMGYIHIASHSFAHAKDPALSGIAFQQPGLTARGEDGILYASEIMGLRLNANLLVLSSCESAVGPYETGEGPLTLTHACLSAGAKNVLSSLWKVNDRHTATLMNSFYRSELDGHSLNDSLRKAKLRLIKSKKTAAPFLWAPFVLYGG